MEDQRKEDHEEYHIAYSLVCEFAEKAKARHCDGYLDMAAECIDIMISAIKIEGRFSRFPFIGYWESVASWVPDALKQYELD